MIPQLIYLVLTLIGFGIALSKHGEPREDHNAWITIFSTVIVYWILYKGGFFDVFFI